MFLSNSFLYVSLAICETVPCSQSTKLFLPPNQQHLFFLPISETFPPSQSAKLVLPPNQRKLSFFPFSETFSLLPRSETVSFLPISKTCSFLPISETVSKPISETWFQKVLQYCWCLPYEQTPYPFLCTG